MRTFSRNARLALAIVAALHLAAFAGPVLAHAQEQSAPEPCDGWLDKATCAVEDAAGKIDLPGVDAPDIDLPLPDVAMPALEGWPSPLDADWPPGWWPAELPARLPPLPENASVEQARQWWEYAMAQAIAATDMARAWLETTGRDYLDLAGPGLARAATDGTLARYAPRATMLACSATLVAPQIGGLCLAAKGVQAFIIVTLVINQFLTPGSVPVTGNGAAP